MVQCCQQRHQSLSEVYSPGIDPDVHKMNLPVMEDLSYWTQGAAEGVGQEGAWENLGLVAIKYVRNMWKMAQEDMLELNERLRCRLWH